MPSGTATEAKPGAKSTKTAAKTASKPIARATDLPFRDLQMEALLTDNGFTSFSLYPDIPLREFDEEASLHNQARVGHPLDRANVDRIVTAKRNGKTMPAIVAWEKSGGEKLLIIDGNHRYASAKQLNEDMIPTYILRDPTITPAQITRLTFIVNLGHGLPTDEKTRIQQGLYLIDQNMTVTEAARVLDVVYSKLNAAWRLAQANTRATEQGINRVAWDRLSASHRSRLAQIPTDEIFALATQLTIDAHLGMEDLSRLMSELTARKSFDKQRKYLQDLRKELDDRIRTGGAVEGNNVGRGNRSARTVFSMMLGQVEAAPSAAAAFERMTAADRQEMAARVRRARDVLNAYLAELDPQPEG